MGDYADDALDRAWDEVDHFEKFKDSDMPTQYDEGIIDESGVTIGDPSWTPINSLIRNLF